MRSADPALLRRRGGVRAKRKRNARELPLTLSQPLLAWFDMQAPTSYDVDTGVIEWRSRGGTLAAASAKFSQATAGNQPPLAASVALLGSNPALQFDGVNKFMDTVSAAPWAVMHHTCTYVMVEYIDSTGPSNQGVIQTCQGGLSDYGFRELFGSSLIASRVANGSGTYLNSWNINTAAHYARNVARWRAMTVGSGFRRSYVSGSAISNAHTGGQSPAANDPTHALRIGGTVGSSSNLKGYIGELQIYSGELTASEITTRLAPYLAAKWGVSA